MRGLLFLCRLLLTTVLLGTAACGSETGRSTPGSGTAYVERVEEGVLQRVYDGSRPPAADPFQPTLTTVYGADQGPDTYFIGRFWSGQVERLTDGTLFVFDRDQRTVHVFEPDGSHRGSFGREGQGPGEFQRVAGMATVDGELHLFDRQNMRISVFDLSGGLLRETRLNPALGNPRTMPTLLLPWSEAVSRRYVAVSQVIFEIPRQSAEFRLVVYLLNEEAGLTEAIADTVLAIPRVYEAGRTWSNPYERYC
ncbi:6-bladed beta-propeller, partial [Gemmatimonadota bacterium]